MKRVIWIALGMGTVISGAAAIGVETHAMPEATTLSHAQRAVVVDSARRAQRGAIETRYQAHRARCDNLAGVRKDNCLIDAHARKGLAMLEAAAPYQYE
jgi:hypothetical protein